MRVSQRSCPEGGIVLRPRLVEEAALADAIVDALGVQLQLEIGVAAEAQHLVHLAPVGPEADPAQQMARQQPLLRPFLAQRPRERSRLLPPASAASGERERWQSDGEDHREPFAEPRHARRRSSAPARGPVEDRERSRRPTRARMPHRLTSKPIGAFDDVARIGSAARAIAGRCSRARAAARVQGGTPRPSFSAACPYSAAVVDLRRGRRLVDPHVDLHDRVVVQVEDAAHGVVARRHRRAAGVLQVPEGRELILQRRLVAAGRAGGRGTDRRSLPRGWCEPGCRRCRRTGRGRG